MARQAGAIYTSATLTGNGNSGVRDFGGNFDTAFFGLVGQNLLTDETLDLTMDFYWDSAGTLSLGTITFDQLTAGSLTDIELWPGDITTRDHPIHIPRFYKLSWVLGGSSKSMNFILYADLQGHDR